MDLLLSTEGRINRKQVWLGFVILIVFGTIISLVSTFLSTAMGTLSKWNGLALPLVLIFPAV